MCIDMSGSKFRYRVNVNFLYMDQVQILDFESIIRNLPNLEHLTLMNMRYFRCEWLNGTPSGINLHTNMCVSYPTTVSTTTTTSYPMTEYTTASYWTSTGEYFNNIFFSKFSYFVSFLNFLVCSKISWILILLTSSCLILILITVIGWICVKCNVKRCSAESRMNSTSNEDFEMTSVFNENF